MSNCCKLSPPTAITRKFKFCPRLIIVDNMAKCLVFDSQDWIKV
uniref:Similarity n=1 Tax=Microcystis aeruginosa (strain PCC 7806) TaxID=267872 RepID=A8YD94_MICA7|nr:unnamed protein product [Microcystis aeruginosa PCC 7806]